MFSFLLLFSASSRQPSPDSFGWKNRLREKCNRQHHPGTKCFKIRDISSSVTKQCEKFHAIINGRKVSVIDSPGLFDTSLTSDEVIDRIKICIPLSAPGPHVFLVVIQLGRFTDDDAKVARIIQAIFGEESSTYTMVLFTHGDQLEDKTFTHL